MKGKEILIVMISINLVYIAFTFACASGGAGVCPDLDGSLIANLFNLGPENDLYSSSGLAVSDSFNSEVGSITDAQSGAQSQDESSGFSFGIILDGLKMVLGFIAILTPVPILDMLAATGVPLIITMFLGVPIIIIWFVNVIELIRGASFGS